MKDKQWLRKQFYLAGRLTSKAVENLPRFKEDTEDKQRRKKKDITERITDAAVVAGKTALAALAKRPGIQASLESLKMRFSTGKAEEHEVIGEIDKISDHIIALLHERAISLQRLAVDGVPGSGKSTLARSLAKKLNFKVRTLDHIDLNQPQDFSRLMTIYEHHRLLRTQNIDNFDAIVYIDEPPELSQAKCLHRKRGGINIDVFDYQRLKRIGEEAFRIADGKAYTIADSYVKVKIKPKPGFKAYENIRDKVQKKGFRTKGYSKEELLFLSVYGQPKQGLMAYVNFGAYNEEILQGLNAGILRFLTA